MLVLGSGLAVSTQGPVEAAAFTPETHTVAVDDPEGVWTSQSLEAGELYRAEAQGVYYYGGDGVYMFADVECSRDDRGLNMWADNEAARSWNRHRYIFFGTAEFSTGNSMANSDFRDPDPTDDPLDLYIDNRNVEWNPIGGSPGGCHTNDPNVKNANKHRYEAYFAPRMDGPVNLRIFDPYYADNSVLPTSIQPERPNDITVTVSAVTSNGPVPASRHIETLLVNAEGEPQTSRPLTDGTKYRIVAHGMWTYRGDWYLADAACTRIPTDRVYKPDRFVKQYDSNGGELWIDGAAVPWAPVVRGQVGYWTNRPSNPVVVQSSTCDATSHYYTHQVTGTGAPITANLEPSPITFDYPMTGGVSVEIFELEA
jgi:hypothetical protein